MPSSKTAAGHLAAILTVFIWGTTFISTKLLLVDFAPIEILFFRFAIGYLALLAMQPHLIRPRSLREELLFAGAGISGVTLYFLCENIALTYTLASNVGIIVSVAPFLTAVLAHFFLKGEPLRPAFFAGFLIAIAGIALISLNGSFELNLNPMGDILALLACVCWAAYSVFMRKIGTLGHPNIAVTRRVFFYGLLLMLPVMPLTGFRWELGRLLNPTNAFNLLFLGLGASALCFVTWNWCVNILGAVKTSNYIYLVPIVAVLFSALILREQITVTALIGMLLTLAGLYFSERKAHAPSTSKGDKL